MRSDVSLKRPDGYSHVRTNYTTTYRTVLMGTKSCTKILFLSTRFSCENLVVEDFVTLVVGKKSCSGGNVLRKIRTRVDLLNIPQSGGKKCQNV